MLSSISWTQYLTVVLVLLFFYYLYVILKYYRADFTKPSRTSRPELATATGEVQQAKDMAFRPNADLFKQAETEVDNSYDQIGELIQELKEHIAKDADSVIVNENLADELKMIIAKYPALKHSPYKSAINDLIFAECEKYGLTALQDEAIEQLWI